MSDTKKLRELASACNNGACNVRGILRSLGEAIPAGLEWRAQESVELKIIIGQIAFLIGESAGPSIESIQAFERLQTAGTFIPEKCEVAA